MCKLAQATPPLKLKRLTIVFQTVNETTDLNTDCTITNGVLFQNELYINQYQNLKNHTQVVIFLTQRPIQTYLYISLNYSYRPHPKSIYSVLPRNFARLTEIRSQGSNNQKTATSLQLKHFRYKA